MGKGCFGPGYSSRNGHYPSPHSLVCNNGWGSVKIVSTPALLKKWVYWVFFAFLIYLIFELLRKILGGSLGFEELVIGLLIANLGYSFYLKDAIKQVDAKISGHIGWHRGKDSGK